MEDNVLCVWGIKVKMKGVENKRELLFYGFIFTFVVAKAFGLDSGDNAYKVLAMVGLAFWLAALSCNRFSQKEYISVLILLLIGGTSLLLSGKVGVILPFLLITGSKGVNIEKVLKSITNVWIGVLIFKVFLVLTGITLNSVVTQKRLSFGNVDRYNMGYGHPNMFHIMFFIGITLFCYTYKKLQKKYYVGLFLLNFAVFKLSYSTTGWLITSLAIVGFVLIEYIDNHFVNYHSWAVWEGVACAMPLAASFLLGFIFKIGDPWWLKIDSYFTGRLKWNYLYMHQYSVPLLGQRFDGRIVNILDNAYLFVLYRYGILVFGLLFLGYILALTKFVKQNEIRKIFFCLLFLIYGFAEQFIQNSFMNFSMFFLCELMWKVSKGNGTN